MTEWDSYGPPVANVQLVKLLRSLNVVTALGPDGGMSPTLYVKGRVLTKSSRGSERPVSTALLVVRNP